MPVWQAIGLRYQGAFTFAGTWTGLILFRRNALVDLWKIDPEW
ncbi:MAG: hypothetical protein ACRD3W_19030 [Terriglobales bacterium]